MKFGVYRKVMVSGQGKGGGVGHLYQFLMLARYHHTGEEAVVYMPLRIEPEWAGTVRPCILSRLDFGRMFEYVGEGLPDDSADFGPDAQLACASGKHDVTFSFALNHESFGVCRRCNVVVRT